MRLSNKCVDSLTILISCITIANFRRTPIGQIFH